MGAGRVGFSRATAILVAGAFFMENLDATIIQTAAPAIARDLGVAPVDVNVALLSYLLAVSVGVPASGWLADRFGVRSVFVVAVVVFTLASLWCGLSSDLASLTVARAAQGLGGALMVPVGRLAVLRTAGRGEPLAAVAYLTWPALVAPVIAPALGGIISDTVGWRYIFFVNIPVGVAAVVTGLLLLERSRPPALERLDLVGFATLAIALTALTIGAESLAGDSAASATLGAVLLAAGIAGAAWTVRSMRRRAHPLLAWEALRIPSFRAGNVSGGVYRLMITAAPFLWALLFQVGYGWSATMAGLVLMAVFVEPAGLGGANTLSSTLQQVATVLGIAVATLALRASTALAEGWLGSPELGYRWCFVIAALVMLIPFAGALRLAPDAGSRALVRPAR